MQHVLIHVSTVEACYVLMFVIHTFTLLTLCLCYYIRNDPGWKRELEKGKRSIIFYEIKVAPQYCFVVYFTTRRASAVGLFSNFERLVELSESTSGVFLHIYILIIGKPPLFQIKFFLLPFSIILCFLYASCMSFSSSLPCLSPYKGKKGTWIHRLTKVEKGVPSTAHKTYFPITSISNSTLSTGVNTTRSF